MGNTKTETKSKSPLILRRSVLSWNDVNTILTIDTITGRFYQVYVKEEIEKKLAKTPKSRNVFMAMRCRTICEQVLPSRKGTRLFQRRRFHTTCLSCRIRRYLKGEINQMDEVQPQIFLARANRPRWKRIIGKAIATIYEYFIV